MQATVSQEKTRLSFIHTLRSYTLSAWVATDTLYALTFVLIIQQTVAASLIASLVLLVAYLFTVVSAVLAIALFSVWIQYKIKGPTKPRKADAPAAPPA